MALIKCTECGKEYSSHAKACPNCSCPNMQYEKIKKNEKKPSIIKFLIITTIILILGFGTVVLWFGTDNIFHSENSDFDTYLIDNNFHVDIPPASEEKPTTQDIKEKEDIWNIKYYVDEFNQPTNYGYVTTNIDGTFSNGATNNSYLLVRAIFDSSNISFELYEYGKYKVSNYSDKKHKIYDIKVKEDSEIVHYYKGSTEPGSNEIIISPFDICSFLNKLKENEKLYIRIEPQDDETTTYLFTLTKDNLIDLYNELFNKQHTFEKTLNKIETSLIGTHSLTKASIVGKPSKFSYAIENEAILTLNENKTFILSLDDINLPEDENDAFSLLTEPFIEGFWNAEYSDIFETEYIHFETTPQISIYGLLEDNAIVVNVEYANDTYKFKFK